MQNHIFKHKIRCKIGAKKHLFCTKNDRFRSDFQLKNLQIKLVFFIILIIALICYCNSKAMPLIVENAKNRADAVLSNCEYDGVMSVLESDEFANAKYVGIKYSSNNAVESIQCNTALLNKLMNDANNEIEAEIDKHNVGTFSVHMGSFFGISSALGKGPELTYKYDLSTNVNCELISEFKSVGINQTNHRIILRVTVITAIILPNGSPSIDVVSDFPVCDTIIAGDVPNGFSQIDLNNKELLKANDK